jgi:hypothetical protein
LLWALLIAPLTLFGLSIQRQLPYAAFAIAPYVAARLSAVLGRRTGPVPVVPRAPAVATLAVMAALAIGGAFAVAPSQPDLDAFPTGAEPYLRRETGHVLNEYDWGGWMIRFAPNVPTFIDGRARTGVLFVPDVLRDWDRAVALRPGYQEVLGVYDVRLVLLRPQRPLAVALREDGWTVLAERPDHWVLLERVR